MIDMETFCTSNAGHSKYRPSLSSLYQPTCHRTLRQNDYALTADYASRRSALLWQEQPQPSSAENRGKICSIALATASFLVLIAVLSIAGLALYVGGLHSETPSNVSFSCSAKILRGDRILGATQEKARRYRLQLDALYQKSVIGQALVSCILQQFGNESSTIYFKLTLNRKKIPRNIINIEKTLKDILLSDGLSRKPIFRNVRFDPRNTFVKQLLENENVYQRIGTKPKDSLKTRNDVFIKPTLRPNLTLTANLPVKNKPTNIETNNNKDLPVIQGSFKITKTEADISEKKIENVTQKTKNLERTTQPPLRKSTINETSITSSLYKIVANKNDITTKIAPTTTTTKTTITSESTETSPSSTQEPNSLSPQFFDIEPWIPIYPNTDSKNTKQSSSTIPPITLLNQNQPVYTSFTNPGLSFHSLDTETLGSTKIKGHPIPVDKIAEMTEPSTWKNTQTIQIDLDIQETITESEQQDNSTNISLIYNKNKTLNKPEDDLETKTSDFYVEIKTFKSPDSNTKIKINNTSEDAELKMNQDKVIRNISTIFHNLASSMGLFPLINLTNTTTLLTPTTTETTLNKIFDELIVGQGQVEVVEDVDESSLMSSTTKLPLVTLLPVKSNSGIRRPLRPRPHLQGKNNTEKDFVENRSFPSDSSINNLNEELIKTEVITSISSETNRVKVNKSHLNDFKIMSVLDFVTETDILDPFEKRIKDSSEIMRHPKMEPKDNLNLNDEIKVLVINSSMTKLQKDYTLSTEKLKQLSEISKLNDNSTRIDDGVISNKAVSSSYTINHAGFKILTKTFNKIPNTYKIDDKRPGFVHNFPISVINNRTECNNFSIKCGDGKCLPDTTRCNQLVDCNDGVDEKNCNCADYLRSQFLLRKICDGVVDCWDFSDENHCDWCKSGQYVCGNSKVCIDKKKICDGTKDCPQGDDERQCVTISPEIQAADEFTYHSEGYLMVRKNGQWGTLCVENFETIVSNSQTNWQVSDLGKAVCKAMTYQNLNYIKRHRENNLKNRYFELVYSFRNETKSSLTFKEAACNKGEVVKLKCGSLECGSRPQATKQMARIVGGNNAGLGSWPWQAALYKEGEFQCGATLLSDRWLLSAGHCFFHSLEDHWVARLGALRRGSTLPSPYEQLRPIIRIILHPGYVDAGFVNDISLLKMEHPVVFSDYVRPICLPSPNSPLKDGRMCTVIGWGQLFEVGRIFPDTLQEVQVPIISTAECRKRTIFLPLYSITDNMFCAGFERGGRDACLGDSGGPLMCPESDGRWVLQGVTSNGYGCARSDRPGVYTKVGNYVKWLQSHMQDDEIKNVTITNKSICLGHRCPLGECLPKNRLCNGFIECSDGSDEKDCS